MKKAIYAFSGDPITYGHVDIIERASKIFTQVIAAIGNNPAKTYIFGADERMAMARQALCHLPNVTVTMFKGMLADYAFENDVNVIIRGLRNSEDFNYELMLHQIAETQVKGIDTFLMPCSKNLVHVSSSAAKALQLEQGFTHQLVPLNVKQQLEDRISAQLIIGVTGEVASGKTTLCHKLKAMVEAQGAKAHVIDIDKLGHEILEKSSESVYVTLRHKIADAFGENLLNAEGFINTTALGETIFKGKHKLSAFNQMLVDPLLLKLRREMYGKRGVILLESAVLAETANLFLCNNNVLITCTDKNNQLKRMAERGYAPEKIEQLLRAQLSFTNKVSAIQQQIKLSHYGRCEIINTEEDVINAFQNISAQLPAFAMF